jgi:hypothetical protein
LPQRLHDARVAGEFRFEEVARVLEAAGRATEDFRLRVFPRAERVFLILEEDAHVGRVLAGAIA